PRGRVEEPPVRADRRGDRRVEVDALHRLDELQPALPRPTLLRTQHDADGDAHRQRTPSTESEHDERPRALGPSLGTPTPRSAESAAGEGRAGPWAGHEPEDAGEANRDEEVPP